MAPGTCNLLFLEVWKLKFLLKCRLRESNPVHYPELSRVLIIRYVHPLVVWFIVTLINRSSVEVQSFWSCFKSRSPELSWVLIIRYVHAFAQRESTLWFCFVQYMWQTRQLLDRPFCQHKSLSESRIYQGANNLFHELHGQCFLYSLGSTSNSF